MSLIDEATIENMVDKIRDYMKDNLGLNDTWKRAELSDEIRMIIKSEIDLMEIPFLLWELRDHIYKVTQSKNTKIVIKDREELYLYFGKKFLALNQLLKIDAILEKYSLKIMDIESIQYGNLTHLRARISKLKTE